MKSIILSVFVFASAAVFAAPSSPVNCQLKVNGQVLWTGTSMDANGQGGIYDISAKTSRAERSCIYAKIDRQANTGRVYMMGQLVPSATGQKKGLSNSEAQSAMASVGGRCTVFSCIDLSTQAPQAPQYPTTGTSGSSY